MRKRNWLAAFGLASIALLLGLSVDAAELVGHSVDYTIAGRNLPPNTTAGGTWQFAVTPACQSWKISQIANLDVKANGQAISLKLTQLGEENVDGLAGKYSVQFAANGQQVQSTAQVSFPAKGQAGKMTSTINAVSTSKDVPGDLLLLTAASQALIDQLAAGQTDFTLKTIGPGAPDGVESVHVQVLANSPFSATPLPSDSGDALKGKMWFVKTTHSGSAGTQVVTMQVHENGVVTRMLTDISGIQLEMTAVRVVLVAKPSC